MRKILAGVLIVCISFFVSVVPSFAVADEAIEEAGKMPKAIEKAFPEGVACRVAASIPGEGKVLAKIAPSSDWTDLVAGQALKKDDSIKTDAHSSVVLEFPNGSTVSIKPNTELSIEELTWDKAAKKIGINMTSGELRTIINKVNAPSEFKVKTPTAICGATGTIFYVKTTATGTSVYVGEGSINVVNPVTGETYAVVAGMMLTINSDGSVDGPRLATDDEIIGWTSFYTDITAEPYTFVPGGENQGLVEGPQETPERPGQNQASPI